jgi:hypothetical protein
MKTQGARKDMRKGGGVKGPGTTTSDSIPAKLSKNEVVINAKAAKKFGVSKLLKINNAGLTPAQRRK